MGTEEHGLHRRHTHTCTGHCVKVFLSFFSPEIQTTFEEEMIANPNMKFKDMTNSFWRTYGRVNKEEVKDNTDRLTTVWQLHQGFKALVAQIKTYLVHS